LKTAKGTTAYTFQMTTGREKLLLKRKKILSGLDKKDKPLTQKIKIEAEKENNKINTNWRQFARNPG
jgi:hypothetical protein